ncbi:hypothetical protein KA005_32445, partial [bacterium]|nr:hypothetical protein [bacterium]
MHRRTVLGTILFTVLVLFGALSEFLGLTDIPEKIDGAMDWINLNMTWEAIRIWIVPGIAVFILLLAYLDKIVANLKHLFIKDEDIPYRMDMTFEEVLLYVQRETKFGASKNQDEIIRRIMDAASKRDI